MNVADHVQMHQQHQAWRSEHSQWEHDLKAWRKGLSSISLTQLETALKQHTNVLDSHVEAIRAGETVMDRHEAALVEYERGGGSGELIDLALEHGQESENRAQVRQAHERLKRCQHEARLHWNSLLKCLSEAASAAAPACASGAPEVTRGNLLQVSQ